MRKIAHFVVEKSRAVLIVFAVLVLLCALLSTRVSVNYKLSDYLPAKAPSVKAIDVMKKEFREPIPNLRIALPRASIPEVLTLEEKLRKDPEVELVLWLDTYVSVEMPLEIIEPRLLESYYKAEEDGKGGTALISLAVNSKNENESLDRIKKIVGKEAHYDGEIVDSAFQQTATNSEIGLVITFVVPICLLILILATRSWLDPLLMIVTIGVAIVLNNGTNLIFRQVSFITQAVSAILQLAVSMDYTIFFLDAWIANKNAGFKGDEALEMAIVSSSQAVVASALTTVFGFLVLAFMRFRLGADLGFVLAKGIAFSLIAVIFFLPCLIKETEKWIVRFQHPPILPNFHKVSAFVLARRKYLLYLLILIPIVFIAQGKNDFTYGNGKFPKKSQIYQDQAFINDRFKPNRALVILAPQGQWGKEKTMVRTLADLPRVESILSYTEAISEAVPFQVVPPKARSSFLSEKYSRIIMNTTSPEEGPEAFDLVRKTRDIARKYYGDDALVLGQTVTLLDMKETVNQDNRIVNLLAILSIALIIAFTFKSVILPVILVLTIEFSIWINMSIPFFTRTNLSYIGYLIISSIQLGATVDYAILYTSNYLRLRRVKGLDETIYESGILTYSSIMTPAVILTCAGFMLNRISSLEVVKELGTCLARGAALSLLLVIFLLPALIYQFDPYIEAFTQDAFFFHPEGEVVQPIHFDFLDKVKKFLRAREKGKKGPEKLDQAMDYGHAQNQTQAQNQTSFKDDGHITAPLAPEPLLPRPKTPSFREKAMSKEKLGKREMANPKEKSPASNKKLPFFRKKAPSSRKKKPVTLEKKPSLFSRLFHKKRKGLEAVRRKEKVKKTFTPSTLPDPKKNNSDFIQTKEDQELADKIKDLVKNAYQSAGGEEKPVPDKPDNQNVRKGGRK